MDKLFMCAIMLIVLITIICFHYIRFVPHNDILFESLNIDYGDLNHQVVGLYIIRTHLLSSKLKKLCTDWYSHWSLMVRTDNNKMFIFSSSRYPNLYIYEVFPEMIYKSDDGYYIKKSDITPYFKITNMYENFYKKCTAQDVMKYKMKIIRRYKYDMLQYNCQFICMETLRHFCNVDDEKLISNGTLISESIKEFLKGKGYKY